MIKLNVWLTLEAGRTVLCGEMVCSDPAASGRIDGAFRYFRDYLADPEAFALDPVHLPLQERVFLADRPGGIHSVFEDSLPDSWGRRLLIRKAGLPGSRQRPPDLLHTLAGNGLGALSYHEGGYRPADTVIPSTIALADLVEMALRVEAGEWIDDIDISPLLTAGSSPGGARPKALVHTEDDLQWIAKFPSRRDNLPIVRIEAGTMTMAAAASIGVPETRLVDLGPEAVLMVRRFDLSEPGGRFHMISMQTLLGVADEYYVLGYRDMFDVVKKISCQPEIDVPALYRQMVFNMLVGNTDDHLKNFTMLHGERGFFLSPVYDLLPDTENRREHVLHINYGFLFPGIEALVKMGRDLGVSNPGRVVEQVREVVSGYRRFYTEAGVSQKDLETLSFQIERNLKVCTTT
ncbi:MAG: HipA domain-containing protein [Desulfobacterales bacterium]|nr:HipA domain-containing protein [Desulfobacterales bacterium]